MNSRLLLAIPFVFGATIAAAACSSSSSSTTVNPDGGGTGTQTAACATLEACCTKLAAISADSTQATECAKVVTANGAQCGPAYSQLGCTDLGGSTPDGGKTGDTGGGGKDGGSTGNKDTGANDDSGNPGNETGTGNDASGSDGGGDTGGGSTGCTPKALPSGFTPAAAPPPADPTCTSANVTGAEQCFVGTASTQTQCTDAIDGTDGGLDSCGRCVLSAAFTATGENTNWGAFVILDQPVAAGSTMGTQISLFNTAGCIARKDTSSAGTACANALETLSACEYAACASCVVTSQTDQAGITALLGDGTAANPGCLGNADTAICKTYVDAANTACAAEFPDSGTGAGADCNTLEENANMATSASPGGLGAYIDVFCLAGAAGDAGGGDAGGEDAAKEASH